MKNKPDYVKYLVCILLGAGLVYFLFNKTDIDVDIKAYQLKIELLEQKIDSIETQNDSLQIEKQELFDKIQGYDIEIQNLNKKIYVIRKDYKKRLDAVNQFTDAELQKFFSERYSIDNDSIK
tara:strand:- start:816 stop:1181 length:366 start_codon:yes stop_codon:yes gene_type:complete